MQLTMFNVTIFNISFPFLLLLLEVIGKPGHGNYGVRDVNSFGQVLTVGEGLGKIEQRLTCRIMRGIEV
jgi:hypothetical protein